MEMEVSVGRRRSPAVITNRMVEAMQRLRAEKVPLREIGKRLGVAEATVRRNTESDGTNPRKKRLDWDAVFYDVACKVPTKVIAEEHGVHPVYLRRLINKRKDELLPKANARLKQDVREAYLDGDPITNIMVWTGRRRGVIEGWISDLMPPKTKRTRKVVS